MENQPNAADAEQMVINPGDVVRVKKNAKPEGDFTPFTLKRVGWPNEYHVIERSEGKDAISGELVETLVLWECCWHMKNPATGQYLCAGHPVEFFERVQDDGVEPEARRQTSISTPLGDIVNISYYEEGNGEKPSLILKMPGTNGMVVRGELAKGLGRLLRDGGLL